MTSTQGDNAVRPDAPQPMSAITPAPVDRQKFIGGSDIAKILGIDPWRNATDLWLDKITPPVAEGEREIAKQLTRGKRLEPYVIDMARQEFSMPIAAVNQRYIDPAVPFFACEIDAEAHWITMDGETPILPVIENVEIKTVHPFKAKEWGDLESDQLPLHYLAQVQWGLGITGRRRCHVFALIGDDLRPYVVERDEPTIEAMRRRAEHFWNTFVIPKVQPPLDYADPRGLETLKRLYPGTDGTTIYANVGHEHWRAVLATAEEMAAKYEAVADGAKMHILAEMGNAAVLRFSDGKGFRRKEVKVKGRTQVVEPYSFMSLKLVNLKEE